MYKDKKIVSDYSAFYVQNDSIRSLLKTRSANGYLEGPENKRSMIFPHTLAHLFTMTESLSLFSAVGRGLCAVDLSCPLGRCAGGPQGLFESVYETLQFAALDLGLFPFPWRWCVGNGLEFSGYFG